MLMGDLGDGDVIARVDEVLSEPFDLVAVMAFLEDVIFLRAFGEGAPTPPPHEVCEFVGCEGGQGHDRTLVRRSRLDDRSRHSHPSAEEL